MIVLLLGAPFQLSSACTYPSGSSFLLSASIRTSSITIIGTAYADNISRENWINVSPGGKRELVRLQFTELLPVFEHNPAIVFHWRKGVRFDDGLRPSPIRSPVYKKDDAYQYFSSLGFSCIGYNNQRGLFTDKRIRGALGMAINVDEIIKYVLYEEGE